MWLDSSRLENSLDLFILAVDFRSQTIISIPSDVVKLCLCSCELASWIVCIFFTSFGWLFLSFCQLILLFNYFRLLWIWCPELFDSWILDLGCSPQPSSPSRCHSYRHSSISNDVPQSNTGISHSTLRFKMSSFNKSILWKFLPLDRQCLNGQSNSRCGNYLSPFLTESILYRTFGNLYALTQLTFTLAYPLNFFFVGFVFEWYSNDYFASL